MTPRLSQHKRQRIMQRRDLDTRKIEDVVFDDIMTADE